MSEKYTVMMDGREPWFHRNDYPLTHDEVCETLNTQSATIARLEAEVKELRENALRSLFPVVKLEDTKANEFYWCYFAEHDAWQSRAGWYLQRSSYVPTEIRACPSPADLGLGVRE